MIRRTRMDFDRVRAMSASEGCRHQTKDAPRKSEWSQGEEDGADDVHLSLSLYWIGRAGRQQRLDSAERLLLSDRETPHRIADNGPGATPDSPSASRRARCRVDSFSGVAAIAVF